MVHGIIMSTNSQIAFTMTIVTPSFNEESNLEALHQRLSEVCAADHVDFEWLIIDDHSSDGTFEQIKSLAEKDARVRGIRLSRNFGSHSAVLCGLEHARGEVMVVMAADLQDPPDVIPDLVAKWKQGADIVWAVRAKREGESFQNLAAARLFYWIMKHVGGVPETPAQGADFFLINSKVMQSLSSFRERNINIFSLLGKKIPSRPAP